MAKRLSLAELERLVHAEVPRDELPEILGKLQEDRGLAQMLTRLQEEDRMIAETLAAKVVSAPTARIQVQTLTGASARGRRRPVLLEVGRRLRSVGLRRAAVAALVFVCAVGASFCGGYTTATNAMLGAGGIRREDARAIKDVVRSYIASARRRDLEGMYQLSDSAWRAGHTAAELTRTDVHIMGNDLEVGEVSTTWREKPETSLPLFQRGGPGGMALVFFVARENGHWVVNRSRQAEEEVQVDRLVQERVALCAELIEAHRDTFEEEGRFTILYQSLSGDQRQALKRTFGIVDDSGALTKFGRRLTDLEQAKVTVEAKRPDRRDVVVIHLVTESGGDDFLAVHLEQGEK